MDTQRYKRIRSLLHGVNRQRKLQARKIDILCNDMIEANRILLNRLELITFSAYLTQALVGCDSTSELAANLGTQMRTRCKQLSVSLLSLQQQDVLIAASYAPEAANPMMENFLSCFTAENVRDTCRENAVCRLDDMVRLNVMLPATVSEHLCAAAIPLRYNHTPQGILLLKTPAQTGLPEYLVQTAKTLAIPLARALARF